MAVRKTLQIGDPRLKAPNKIVKDVNDPKVLQVIQDLTDTMHQEGLVGMAAPQIGENYQIYVTEPRQTETRPADQADELRIYINPKIVSQSNEISIIYEGCGSVCKGQLFGPVKRPKEICVKATGQNGKKFRLTCDGLLGRVIQHEHDHLSGIEFTEKIDDYKKLCSREHYLAGPKNSPEQVQASIITKKEVQFL